MTKIISLVLVIGITSSCNQKLPEIEILTREAQLINWDECPSEKIFINAPISQVWSYASNSDYAQDWSVYFDHISPLAGIPDGQVGSLRRCFRNKNEEGPYWDEVTIKVIPEAIREIVTYNLNGFPLNFLTNSQYVFVRQVYKATGHSGTELTFQTTTSPSAHLLSRFLFFISKNQTTKIFQKNLVNIKAAIEGKERIFPWE